MKRKDQLNRLADEYVEEHKCERVLVEAEAKKLRSKLQRMEANIFRLGDIAARRRAYDPEKNQIPNCPCCSIDKGRPVPLAQSKQITIMDEWLCRVCGETFTLTLP